jgi:hypothetical protein
MKRAALGAALLAAVALGGCRADAPGEAASVQPPLRQCAAMGGTVREVGLARARACVIPYADAGKRCSDDSECIGRCLIEQWEGDHPPVPGDAAAGRCERTNQTFGCSAEIRGGKLATPFVCID